jgi:hypothetical protein
MMRRLGRFGVEFILIVVFAVVWFYLEDCYRKSHPPPSPPPHFARWREWVGHDPVEPLDHYLQVLENTGSSVVLREVAVQVVPDGRGGFRRGPVPGAFLTGSSAQRHFFYFDGSTALPALKLPDGSTLTPNGPFYVR